MTRKGEGLYLYKEVEDVIDKFKKNLSDTVSPTVLYGLGPVTKDLLENIQEYNIVGLMDGKKKSGTIWGQDIIDLPELLDRKVTKIVIIAKQPSVPLIYYRIADFCKENDIYVCDINGRDLRKIYSNLEINHPYFELNEEDLLGKIRKSTIVSFDIFDTLIVRKTLYPRDIFKIVEYRINQDREYLQGKKEYLPFSEMRGQAEDCLNQRGMNPTIYEIYKEISETYHIDKSLTDQWLEYEIETELQYIRPRKKMLELFDQIKEDKPVYLITDMYLPKEILKKILEKCGYKGYQDIYVSSEKKKNKSQGLFKLFREDVCEGTQCIHIGDSDTADYRAALGAGINAYWIMSEREMLLNSSYSKLMQHDPGLCDHLAIGLLINELFDDPFALYHSKGKPRICTLEDYARLLVAPMVFYYTIWLIQEIKRNCCEYVLYTSRDAYLIQKILQMIFYGQKLDDFPPGTYFYTSRRTCIAANVTNKDDILKVIKDKYNGNIREMFKHKFNINISDEYAEIPSSNKEQSRKCADIYEEHILEECKRERNNYLSYIRSLGIKGNKKIAVIDLVARGTVQYELSKIIPSDNLLGMYFVKTKDDYDRKIERHKYRSFYKDPGKYNMDCSNAYRFYQVLELILTSPEPTFHSVSDEGTFEFMKEQRSSWQIEKTGTMQKAILKYSEEMIRLLPDIMQMEIHSEIPDDILGFTSRKYTSLQIEELKSLYLYSDTDHMVFHVFSEY